MGIDPGSVLLGYGVISTERNKMLHVAHDHIKVQGDCLPSKLAYIYKVITEVLIEHNPKEVAIENVFIAKNAQSALKLGQARGAAICAVANKVIPISEYAPRLIKQSAVGHGGADKEQIQKMMQILFELECLPQSDAADGLAIAVCHANHASITNKFGAGVSIARRKKPKRRKAI